MMVRRQLPVSSPVSLSALGHGLAGALGLESAMKEIADMLATRHETTAVTFCDSGTSALVLAIRAAVKPGGTVAFPSYSCVDLAAAARFTGVSVRLYDLDPATLSVDLASLKEALQRGVDAVVAVHHYGFPTDVPAIRTIAHAQGVSVIEDAAQAAGGRLHGRWLGGFGDLSILSFGRGKGTTGGSGGAIMTTDASWTARVAEHARRVTDTSGAGWKDLTRAAAQWLLGRPSLYALPSAIPALHLGEMVYHPAHEPRGLSRAAATLVHAALERDSAEIARRREHAALLAGVIGASDTLAAVRPIANAEPGYLRLPVLDRGGRAPAPALGVTRGYPRALYEQPELRPCLLPDEPEPLGGRALRETLFTLPVHSYLTSRDLDRLRGWVTSLPR